MNCTIATSSPPDGGGGVGSEGGAPYHLYEPSLAITILVREIQVQNCRLTCANVK